MVQRYTRGPEKGGDGEEKGKVQHSRGERERQGAEGIGCVLVKDALGVGAGTGGHECTVTVW